MADLADESFELEEIHREKALAQIRDQGYQGKSSPFCIECDEDIPKKRQELLPGVKLCVDCAEFFGS